MQLMEMNIYSFMKDISTLRNCHCAVFNGWTQSSDGFYDTIFICPKNKNTWNLTAWVTHFKHKYWILQVWYVLCSVESTVL